MSIHVSLEKISSEYLCWAEKGRFPSENIENLFGLSCVFGWAFGRKSEMVWARIRRGKGCWSNAMWSAFVYECSRFVSTKLRSINSFDFLSHPPTRHVIDYFTRRRSTQPHWIFTSSLRVETRAKLCKQHLVELPIPEHTGIASKRIYFRSHTWKQTLLV